MPFQNCRRQPIAATPFNEPQGVSLCASDTGTEDLVIELDPESHFGPAFPFCRGQRAIASMGEAFGERVSWQDEDLETRVAIVTSKDTDKPVLLVEMVDHEAERFFTCVYRGFEAETLTWWRWEHEADPAQYREHCIRVTELPDF